MPYVERVTRAGKTIEVERYFTSRYKKPGIKRGDKVKPTKEEQKKVNTRAAERKLRLLLNANFGYGDYHLELDYIRKKGQPDRSREQIPANGDTEIAARNFASRSYEAEKQERLKRRIAILKMQASI